MGLPTSSTEEIELRDILKHLDRESAHFVIRLDAHPSGRNVTIVQPHDRIRDSIDLEQLLHKLRKALGTGGSVEKGQIVLHGDHRGGAKDELVKLGVQPENIEVFS